MLPYTSYAGHLGFSEMNEVSLQAPQTKPFSGEEVPRKHEISFNRWLFAVRTIQPSYAEPLVREAIMRSVRG